ncbi:hypothetical protein [Streptomyces sp. NPDC052012]|uniref:hypothetical protein n=1 Tax=Streptomyces sp. NPDC052012 TaxID=3155051 RepID=UPI00344BD337
MAATPRTDHLALVGAWTAQVRRETETSATVLHFTGDGRVFLSGGGAGHWEPAGAGGFAFRVAEPLFDERGPEAGACVGWVDIDQLALLDGDTFRSEGVSVVRDADTGRTLRTKRVTVTARLADHPRTAPRT